MARSQLNFLVLGLGALGLHGCSSTPATPEQNCGTGTPIEAGAMVNGTLGPGDEIDFDGSFLDAYILDVPSVRTLAITMRSAELDSWLWFLSAFTVLAADDDEGGGVNGEDAQIVRTVPGGCYRIEATTTVVGAQGAYTLTIEEF